MLKSVTAASAVIVSPVATPGSASRRPFPTHLGSLSLPLPEILKDW